MRGTFQRQARGAAIALLGTAFALLASGCSSSGSAGADAGPGSKDAGTPLSAPTLFQVHGQLTLTPNQPLASQVIASPPTQQDFLLYVDPVAPRVVSFGDGKGWGASASVAGVSYDVAPGFSVGLSGSCGGTNVSYSSFQFSADATAGTVSGTAKGTADLFSGDEAFSYAAALTFTGTRDVTVPAFDLPSSMDPFHPPDLRARGLLPDSATAQLVAGGESITLAPIQSVMTDDAPSFVFGFTFPPGMLPRYETTYDVAVTPWQDLAGNPGAPLGQLVTGPAPALVAREDFEDPATESGDGVIVDATVLPPISGHGSAVMLVRGGYGSALALDSPHVTARLQVAPGDTVVRFSVRPFSSLTSAGTQGVRMQVGVPGGAITAAVLPASETMTPVAGAVGVNLGDVRTIEIPLPAGATNEVVVDLSTTQPSQCALPFPPPVSYLIDELRVE